MSSRPYYAGMNDEVHDLSTRFEHLAVNYTYQKGAAQLAGSKTPSICACDCRCQNCMCRPRSGMVETTRVGFGGYDTGQLAALQRQLAEFEARFTFSTSMSSRGGPTFSTVGRSSFASSAAADSLEQHRRVNAYSSRQDLAQLSINRYSEDIDRDPWSHFLEESVLSGQSLAGSPMLHGQMDITDSIHTDVNRAREELSTWAESFGRDATPTNTVSNTILQGTGSAFSPVPRATTLITPLSLTSDCRHAKHHKVCEVCVKRRHST